MRAHMSEVVCGQVICVLKNFHMLILTPSLKNDLTICVLDILVQTAPYALIARAQRHYFSITLTNQSTRPI